MRAQVIDRTGDAARFRAADVPIPAPLLSEVLVRVVAAGVDPLDVQTRRGAGVAAGIAAYPAVLGFGFSGVVAAAPYASHPLPPGTEVFGTVAFPRSGGTYAEYAVAPSLSLARKPVTLSHVEAAGVPLAALTAWGMVVDTARAHSGQRILVHGASSGVGHFAVQLAAHFGAHVTATGAGGDLTWLRGLGASIALERADQVSGGVDVVVDLVGDAPVAQLRPRGLLITASPGTAVDGVRVTGYRPAPDGGVLSTIARLLDAGSVRAYVDRVFDLADVDAAHAELESGRIRGTLALRI